MSTPISDSVPDVGKCFFGRGRGGATGGRCTPAARAHGHAHPAPSARGVRAPRGGGEGGARVRGVRRHARSGRRRPPATHARTHTLPALKTPTAQGTTPTPKKWSPRLATTFQTYRSKTRSNSRLTWGRGARRRRAKARAARGRGRAAGLLAATPRAATCPPCPPARTPARPPPPHGPHPRTAPTHPPTHPPTPLRAGQPGGVVESVKAASSGVAEQLKQANPATRDYTAPRD